MGYVRVTSRGLVLDYGRVSLGQLAVRLVLVWVHVWVVHDHPKDPNHHLSKVLHLSWISNTVHTTPPQSCCSSSTGVVVRDRRPCQPISALVPSPWKASTGTVSMSLITMIITIQYQANQRLYTLRLNPFLFLYCVVVVIYRHYTWPSQI